MTISKTIEVSDVEKLCQSILEYNLIISTTSGTVDTSTYNIVDFSDTEVGGLSSVVDRNQENGCIMLAYNPKGPQKIGRNELKKDSGFKTMVIPFNTIESIKIKSKRNFLMNQVDIKKPLGSYIDKITELENQVNANLPKLFPHSNKQGGKLDIPTNSGTVVMEWHEIRELDFGVGAHNNSAQIPLQTTMTEVHSVHVQAQASGKNGGQGSPGGSGDPWDFPVFQCSLIGDGRTVQIMSNKGGHHTLHLLVIGKK